MKKELVPYTESAPTFELLETKRVSIAGVEFEESFIAGLVGEYFSRQFLGMRPKLSTALKIYIKEKDGYRRHKFLVDTTRCFMNFTEQFGDVYLDEIKHYHAVQYRDLRLGHIAWRKLALLNPVHPADQQESNERQRILKCLTSPPNWGTSSCQSGISRLS